MLTDLDNLQNIQCLLNFSIQADYRDIKSLHKNNSTTVNMMQNQEVNVITKNIKFF